MFDIVNESLLNLCCLKHKNNSSGLMNKLYINDFFHLPMLDAGAQRKRFL